VHPIIPKMAGTLSKMKIKTVYFVNSVKYEVALD